MPAYPVCRQSSLPLSEDEVRHVCSLHFHRPWLYKISVDIEVGAHDCCVANNDLLEQLAVTSGDRSHQWGLTEPVIGTDMA